MNRNDAQRAINRYIMSGEQEDLPSKEALLEAVKAVQELERMEKGTLTNEQKIRRMNTEQFARFLEDIANAYHVEAVLICDSTECPHGSEVAWWLRQPANMEEYVPYEETSKEMQ